MSMVVQNQVDIGVFMLFINIRRKMNAMMD